MVRKTRRSPLERLAMSLVHEPSWVAGCLFGRSQTEDSRGRPGAPHEPERGRSRFLCEPLLGQALREGGAPGASALVGEGPGQETFARREGEEVAGSLGAGAPVRQAQTQAEEYLRKTAGVSVSESTPLSLGRSALWVSAEKKDAGCEGARGVPKGHFSGDGDVLDRLGAHGVLKDECSTNTSLAPLYGWGRKGEAGQPEGEGSAQLTGART